MKAKKITVGETENLKVASLPTRPTAPSAFGGRGYTATEMKEAFDKLPLYIVSKYNELIDSIGATGENSVANEIKTEISDDHTLQNLFSDITDGALANYMNVFETTLAEYLLKLRTDINTLAERLNIDLNI